MDASSNFQDSLPVSADALVADLRAKGFRFSEHYHVPLKTVAESQESRGDMLPEEAGGGHIKNLYLRDRKKANYLFVVREDREVDLKVLSDLTGAARFSFGSAERLMQHLGVRPGAVTPMAMITGVKTGVTLYLDASLRDCREIYMHPLVNDRTIGMSPADLERFLNGLGCPYSWLDMPG